MTRLKLLCVAHTVGFGGAALSLRGLVSAYDDAEIDVAVPRFANVPDDDAIREFFGPRLRRVFRFWLPRSEVYVGHAEVWQSARSYFMFPAMWRAQRPRFTRFVAREGYDAVHLNSLVLHPMVSAELPCILHVREILTERRAAVMADAGRARGTIFIDEATRAPFVRPPPRHVILNNPVDMTGVGTLPRDAASRLGGDPARLGIFAMIGDVTDEKGAAFVVEAFRAVRSPDARLVLVGRVQPAARAKLERLAGGDRRIVLWGEEREIDQIYTLADHVLRGEAYPCVGRTIYEALYAGCGVVVPGDRASHGMFEFERFADRIEFYPPRDQRRLVDRLDALAGQKRTTKRGESNVRRYVTEFDRFVREAIRT
jgi:hypothetical protein